ncbi:MAG TPA: DUF2934 domain-containing protein [bacterium]|nr:DUF2934 domain-containing protein [bacterium]
MAKLKNKTDLPAKKDTGVKIPRTQSIQEAAYHRWLARGAFHGMDLDDWFWAQKELERNVFERDAEP